MNVVCITQLENCFTSLVIGRRLSFLAFTVARVLSAVGSLSACTYARFLRAPRICIYIIYRGREREMDIDNDMKHTSMPTQSAHGPLTPHSCSRHIFLRAQAARNEKKKWPAASTD